MNKGIAVVLLAMLAISSFSYIQNIVQADVQSESLWIRMRGIVKQWGDKQVFGWLGVHARMLNVNGTYKEWAGVHAIWSEEPRHLNCTEPPTENFTFVCYAARMINTTEVALNYSGYNLFISGYWNVVKITTSVYVTENGELINITRTIEPVVTEALGELDVFTNWHLFELSINGIDKLSGIVMGAVIQYHEIKICDLNDDGKVDLIELVKVAMMFRTVPGLYKFDMNMDFNFNNEIDIGDLTTIAANIE
jgi:hypothetical protein